LTPKSTTLDDLKRPYHFIGQVMHIWSPTRKFDKKDKGV